MKDYSVADKKEEHGYLRDNYTYFYVKHILWSIIRTVVSRRFL